MKGKTSKLVMLLISFAFILLFQFIPAPAGLNQTSMQVIGIFIGVILMLSIVDTVWPAMLAIVLLGQSGVCTVNEAIAGSIGNWIIYFVLIKALTFALGKVERRLRKSDVR